MSRLEQYKEVISSFYNTNAKDEESSKKLIHPNFDFATEENQQLVYLVCSYYIQRYGRQPHKVADWGCGIGRLFQAWSNLNILIDGFDVSVPMLEITKSKYPTSTLFHVASDGRIEKGSEIPLSKYDLIYSFLTLQHNCNNYLRMKNLENIQTHLSDTGMVAIQLLYKNRRPEKHHSYTDNIISDITNSGCDGIITKEDLGQVYEDFSLFFHDVSLNFIELPPNRNQNQEHQVIITGTKNPIYFDRIYKDTPTHL